MTTGNTQERTFDNIGSFVEKMACGAARVRDLLERKGRGAYTVSPSSSVLEALKSMARHGVGALVVVEGDRVIGVVSERDYARKVILTGKSSGETSVKEIMSHPASTVSPDQTIAECMTLMTVQRIRHLPVLESGRLAGLVSIGDLVKSIISDQERRIEQFERYIRGAYPA
jgi:CBS domain-containing protein